MSKYIKLECSIFDMKEMLENRELFFSDECNKFEYMPIHNEIELAYIVSSGIHVYRQKTQEEIEAQEVEDLAEYICSEFTRYHGGRVEILNQDKLLLAKIALMWMRQNNDQKN